jgi:hypothetical protein
VVRVGARRQAGLRRHSGGGRTVLHVDGR